MTVVTRPGRWHLVTGVEIGRSCADSRFHVLRFGPNFTLRAVGAATSRCRFKLNFMPYIPLRQH